MDKKKLAELKQLISEKRFYDAGLIIPQILDQQQYRKFIERIRIKLAKDKRPMDAHHFELVEIQIMVLERRLQDLHEAENELQKAQEQEGLCQRVYDDSEQSLDYLSEKASNLMDEEALNIALEVVESQQ